MNDLLFDDILREAGLSGGTALDVGCGTGELAVKLAERGFTLTATDVSEVALDKARKRAQDAKVSNRVTFLRADAHDYQRSTSLPASLSWPSSKTSQTSSVGLSII
jgi:ubiquinone/menaquinone biosynthesis C-methylase UbiE